MSFICELAYDTGSDDFLQITIDSTHEGILLKEINRLLNDKVYYMQIRLNGRAIFSARKESRKDQIIPKFKEWLDRRQDAQMYELVQKFNQLDIGYNLCHEGIGFLNKHEEERAIQVAKEMKLSHLLG